LKWRRAQAAAAALEGVAAEEAPYAVAAAASAQAAQGVAAAAAAATPTPQHRSEHRTQQAIPQPPPHSSARGSEPEPGRPCSLARRNAASPRTPSCRGAS
jgi:ribosomal protein L12E/L44/L45/RPP1/RPP2